MNFWKFVFVVCFGNSNSLWDGFGWKCSGNWNFVEGHSLDSWKTGLMPQIGYLIRNNHTNMRRMHIYIELKWHFQRNKLSDGRNKYRKPMTEHEIEAIKTIQSRILILNVRTVRLLFYLQRTMKWNSNSRFDGCTSSRYSTKSMTFYFIHLAMFACEWTQMHE